MKRLGIKDVIAKPGDTVYIEFTAGIEVCKVQAVRRYLDDSGDEYHVYTVFLFFNEEDRYISLEVDPEEIYTTFEDAYKNVSPIRQS